MTHSVSVYGNWTIDADGNEHTDPVSGDIGVTVGYLLDVIAVVAICWTGESGGTLVTTFSVDVERAVVESICWPGPLSRLPLSMVIDVNCRVTCPVCTAIGCFKAPVPLHRHYGLADEIPATMGLDGELVSCSGNAGVFALTDMMIWAVEPNESVLAELVSVYGDAVAAATELVPINTGTASFEFGPSDGACDSRDWYGISSSTDEIYIALVGFGGRMVVRGSCFDTSATGKSTGGGTFLGVHGTM